MKKILVLVIIVLSSGCLFSTEHSKLTQIIIKPNGCEWGQWNRCLPEPIDVYFKTDENLIIINSYTKLIINYSKLIKIQHIGYYTLSGYGYDNNQQKLGVIREIHENGLSTLHLKYSDGEFMYLIN